VLTARALRRISSKSIWLPSGSSTNEFATASHSRTKTSISRLDALAVFREAGVEHRFDFECLLGLDANLFKCDHQCRNFTIERARSMSLSCRVLHEQALACAKHPLIAGARPDFYCAMEYNSKLSSRRWMGSIIPIGREPKPRDLGGCDRGRKVHGWRWWCILNSFHWHLDVFEMAVPVLIREEPNAS
jgi:hypothetical protein